MILKDKIFGYFGTEEQVTDTLKAAGKGIVQRYNESLADDMDINILPNVINLLENVILPSYCADAYVVLLEESKGNDNLFFKLDIETRRKIIRQVLRYYEIKGSNRAYEIMFALIGFNIEITESYIEGGFDSSTTFDDTLRTFDSTCLSCSSYSITVSRIDGTDTDITATELAAFKSIIVFNNPINAKLEELIFDGEIVIVNIGDYNNDFSLDYF